MTIEAPEAVPATGQPAARESPAPAQAPPRSRAAAARRGTWGRRLWRLGRWTLLLALIALNAGWFWSGSRPRVGLETIARWIEQGRQGQAEQALRHRLERSPHEGEARVLLAKLLAQRHDPMGCARELHQVPFWWPEKARWRIMEAGAFKECDRMRDAEAAWTAVVEDDPLHPVDPKYLTAATRDLLQLYAYEGRWDEMVKLIWRRYDQTDDPMEREDLVMMRLRSELERIMPAVAAARVEKYLAADPQDWQARRGLARARLGQNRPEAGRDLLETCLEERPEDPSGWADYLDLLHTTGDLDGLRQAVARLPAAAAEHPTVLTHRARLLERDRRWPEAAELYRRVLLLRPHELETHYRLALIADRLGQREQAQTHRRRWESMRTARTELNDVYHKVVELHQSDPNSPQYYAAIRRLAQLCRTLGWNRDAEAWAQLAPST
jgi:thioredoxin-like negative regulator of GroEL